MWESVFGEWRADSPLFSDKMTVIKVVLLSVAATLVNPLAAGADTYAPYPDEDFPRQVYWGDTHLHTNHSPDAYLFGNVQLTPDDAYRFARGETMTAHNGMKTRLRRPLDFLAVTDHGEYLGVFPALVRRDPILLANETGLRWADGFRDNHTAVMAEYLSSMVGSTDVIDSDAFERSVWGRVIESAERHNDPGQFTAFVAYEYTPTVDGDNLHRNVIFRDGPEYTGRTIPFSSFDSANPEDLWDYLADYEALTGGSVLSIPHNSNNSAGQMFRTEDTAGNPLTREQAELRAYFEPIVEVTQYKGDSESHPFLSPEDDFADYETWDETDAAMLDPHQDEFFRYEYIRSALMLGIGLLADIGANPFHFGMIGSTDSHTGFAAAEEDNFWGKTTKSEPSAERWRSPMVDPEHLPDDLEFFTVLQEWQMAASGYAAVWATENTRDALFDAMRRKETYATTGPRLTVRFFGGFEFDSEDAYAPDLAQRGYGKGVPMGGELGKSPDDGSPSFLISALKDPDGANLDRVQVVKGWREADGALVEKVYEVALSGNRRPDPVTGKVPPVGNTVDVETATYKNTIGDAALTVVWKDPDFDPAEHSFYYVRVIEIPKPRWTTYDAVRLGAEIPDEVPKTTQDRAYTSPIWYTPPDS